MSRPLRLKIGTRLRLQSKPELATHLVLDGLYQDKALCGADMKTMLSYDVAAKVVGKGRIEQLDGYGCLHHVDCKRCHELLIKYTQP